MVAAESDARTPIHLWIVGVVAVLWNFGGIFDYLATKLRLEFYLSQFDETMLAYVDAMPAWATAAWAFGVWGAFAGSIGLLLRKKWSVWAFGVSLAGLLGGTIYSFGIADAAEMMGIMYIFIWVIAIFLLAYSCAMAKKGVLS
jgi:hypothetical protein